MSDYEAALRRLTADSNEQLFTLVEESSLAYEAGERAGPDPGAARAAAGAVRRTLLDLRNGFVRANADVLLSAVEVGQVAGPVMAPQVH